MGRQRMSGCDDTSTPRVPLPSSPDGWPNDVTYLSESCCPSPGLSSEHARIFCSTPPITSPYHPAVLRSQDWILLKRITSPNHPAYGQCGLFAKRAIPPRTTLLPYLGQVHTEAESDEHSDYDLGLWAPSTKTGTSGQGGEQLGIDATKMGNEARFVNDYRGIAQRPNVEFQEHEMPVKSVISAPSSSEKDVIGSESLQGSLRGLFFQSGSKEIRPGEELLTSYGKGFWAARRQGEEEVHIHPKKRQTKTSDYIGPTKVNAGPQAQPSPASHVQAILERQRARLQNMKAKT